MLCAVRQGLEPRGGNHRRKAVRWTVFPMIDAQSGTEMQSIWVDKQYIRIADVSLMAHIFYFVKRRLKNIKKFVKGLSKNFM